MHFLKKFGAEIIRLVMFAGVLGAVSASGAVWQWSQTAGTNSNADPRINWSIGMAPSAVGASSRAEMAELAKWRDDTSGLVTTGGTSTAYTATSNQGLCVSPSTTPQDGQLFAATINANNGNAPTLQVDTCTAYPIQSSSGAAVAAATLISGTPYTFKFSNANSAWMLRDFFGSSLTVPLGGLIPYTGTSSPNSNFVIPYGQCLSTTTYAAYWVLLGSPASGSCPGGQFQIVDLKGRVTAGLDTMGNGVAANRLTASSAGCGTAMTSVGAACGNESQTLTVAQLPTGITSSGSNNIVVTPTGTAFTGIPVTNSAANIAQASVTNGSNSIVPASSSGSWGGVNSLSGANTINVTSNNTSGSAHPIVQPTIGVVYLLRVL